MRANGARIKKYLSYIKPVILRYLINSNFKWVYYEKRVKDLFYTDGANLLVIAGNHDIGFHYDINDMKLERFNKSYNTKYISLVHSNGKRMDVNFILVNSMALENDNCKFCKETQKELKRLNKTLTCLKYSNCTRLNNRVYSRPIIFTHFPLYRSSDSICPFDIDSEKSVLKDNPRFRPKYDCLSLESTRQVSGVYKH